jgi:hypothetical protein
MRLTVDTGVKKDLTEAEIVSLNNKLRGAIPTLLGWSYSPLTGELTLDFGDAEDNAMIAKINDLAKKAGAIRIIRFEFMDMIKEWIP